MRDHCRAKPSQAAGPSLILLCLVFVTSVSNARAGQSVPDYGRNPEWFPRVFNPYLRQRVPLPQLSNSPRVAGLVRDGKVRLSVRELNAAVVENNLELLAARYTHPIAETDVLRAKSGQAPRGFQGASIPSGLFAGAIGLGLGQAGAFLGSTGGAVSSQGRAVTIPPGGSFDPTFFLNFSYDYTTVPLNTVIVAGVPAVTTPTTFLQGSYQQAFTSGTTFSLSLSNQRQNSNQQFLIYNPSLTSRFSIAVTQQLLNGFGFSINRRFQDVARNNGGIARDLFLQSAITTLSQAQSAYWDVVAARENLSTAEQILSFADKLYADDQQRVQVGTLSAQDLLTDETEIASRKRDLIAARTDLQTKELTLKNLIAKNLDPDFESAPIEPVDPLPEPKDSDIPSMAEALAAAMRNRPELRQAEKGIQNQEIVVRFTRNNLKPTLTAFALLSSAGLAGNRRIPGDSMNPATIIPGGLGQSLSQVARFKYPEYAFGLTLTIPIRNRSAQADNVRARIEERQDRTSLERLRTQIGLEVRQAVIGLIQSKAQIEAAHQATELQAQILAGEMEKLAVGTSSPYQVIQFQRDLETARLAEVQARADYAKALVEMARSTGTTLDQAGMSQEEITNGRVP
jgi:outer membrane protein TolC